MVRGLDIFREYFKDFENQYVLIGGAACDILFANNEGYFRATRDLDVVLIVEALTPEFGERFWEFIEVGKYRNKATSAGKPQFYRFDKPENEAYPKMIELFARTDFALKEMTGVTPIHIDDEASSLSAILLNEDYYNVLLAGKVVVQELSVLRPEYLILFKAKAYMDLSGRKENGENVDSRDIRKHKNDIVRIAVEFALERVGILPTTVVNDMEQFISRLRSEPFDAGLLKNYGVDNEELVDTFRKLYNMSSNQ